MKLIFCPHCHDIVFLIPHIVRSCFCGKAWGKYVDALNAVINEVAIPLGISNTSFSVALQARPEIGQGSRFEAFVIPKVCPTIIVSKEKE